MNEPPPPRHAGVVTPRRDTRTRQGGERPRHAISGAVPARCRAVVGNATEPQSTRPRPDGELRAATDLQHRDRRVDDIVGAAAPDIDSPDGLALHVRHEAVNSCANEFMSCAREGATIGRRQISQTCGTAEDPSQRHRRFTTEDSPHENALHWRPALGRRCWLAEGEQRADGRISSFFYHSLASLNGTWHTRGTRRDATRRTSFRSRRSSRRSS